MTIQPRTAPGHSQITAVGAVYDLIWHLELPPFRDDEPLDELVVRGVLMALASYLNHQQMKARRYHVYPSDELLATQICRSSKTVARVLDYLLRVELLVLVRPELRPGRGRAGRPPIYSLPIDVWQRWGQRVIKRSLNGSDTGVQTITAQTPAADGSDTGVQEGHGSDTGDRKQTMVRTPVSTEPGHPENPAMDVVNPASEPGHARARASSPEKNQWSSNDYDLALPRLAATAMPTPVEVARVERWTCPDCGTLVTVDGAGHRAGATNPCRAWGRGGQVERCPRCGEWVDELQPSKWHVISCSLRRGNESPPMVDQVADAVAAEAAVQLSPEDRALADELQRNLEETRAAETSEPGRRAAAVWAS